MQDLNQYRLTNLEKAVRTLEEDNQNTRILLTEINTKLDIALGLKAEQKATKQQLLVGTFSRILSTSAVAGGAIAIEHGKEIIDLIASVVGSN